MSTNEFVGVPNFRKTNSSRPLIAAAVGRTLTLKTLGVRKPIKPRPDHYCSKLRPAPDAELSIQ